MARPRISDQIENLDTLILEKAWELCKDGSPDSLSLRAVARACNISAPAIYHYYADKGSLITALIVDAYASFSSIMLPAIETHARKDGSKKDNSEIDGKSVFLKLAHVYREWVFENPHKYLFMFGKIPADCSIDASRVAAAAQPSLAALAQFLDGFGRLPDLPAELSKSLNEVAADTGISPEALAAALSVWTRMHGLLVPEIIQQYPSWLSQPKLFFMSEIHKLAKELF